MRSIKQIVREIKYEIKRIVDEEDNKDLEYYDEDNIEDLSFLAEDIPINRLHDYIIENYDTNEIILFTKYLIKDYLFNNYETIIEYVLNNDNIEYKNMIATRLRAIIEDLDIFSSDMSGNTPLLDDGKYIMEIKVSESIPLWIAELMSELGIRRVKFSKYGTAYSMGICGRNV